MIRAALGASFALAIAAPAFAQDHSMHDMSAMDHGAMDHGAMGQAPPAAIADPACPPEHAAMGHCTPKVAATAPGTSAPPPVPTDHYADRQFDPAAMARARERMMEENGGQRFAMLFFNLAEVGVRRGRDALRWDGEGWYGGDIHRLVVKSEGEAALGEKVESAEVQALYSRAVGPYFNLQAGVRQDIRPARARTHLSLGFEGLAPYMFDVEGALFLSTHGELLGRLELWYDQRITQRLIVQPRIEINLAAQDVAATRTGRGLSTAELGLRLRYEIAREFAPYVGVSYEARTGRTADYARSAGEDVRSTHLVIGIRAWF